MTIGTKLCGAMVAAVALAACGGGSSDDVDAAVVVDAARTPDAGNPDAAGPDANLTADADPIFDLANDFSTTTNPLGPWSYGWAATLGGAVTIYPTYDDSAGSPTWSDASHVSLGTPSIWSNRSGSVQNGIPGDGSMSMHPGQAGEYTVAIFTVPVAGTYTAGTELLTGDTGETRATLIVDGTQIDLGVTSASPTHSVEPAVFAAGDTIELWIGDGGDGGLFDNTQVSLHVDRQSSL